MSMTFSEGYVKATIISVLQVLKRKAAYGRAVKKGNENELKMKWHKDK